jgi:RNA polymerase sigma-70 factor (ECF subfamily)
MPVADIDVSNRDNCEASIGDYEAAARKMQDVLSHNLPVFYRIAYRLLGNTEDAEDAVQDALLAAHKNLQQFRRESQMSTWLTAIVFNSARMHLRKRARVHLISLDHPVREEDEYSLSEQLAHHGPSPEDEYRNSELHGYLTRLRAQLSPLTRRTFWLRAVEGHSIRDTSRALGLSSGAVKAHLFRARTKLKRMMNERRPKNPRNHRIAERT